ncbi:MAG: WD40 repeat domain-containing protein [Campylobacterota bacterium]|nr:WD40 repeat domain-containing protein [Campylobacterota bacterium]
MLKPIFALLMLLAITTCAKEIKPVYELKTSGFVTDIIIDEGKLYASTFSGAVDIFDIKSKKKSADIKLPNITDFIGDVVPPKVYSVDRLANKTMMVSEGKSGYRNVFLHDGKTLTLLSESKFFIKKGLFVDEDHILLGLLSSELILFKISTKEVIYRHPILERRSGGSAFSDMVLSEDRKTVATADESGEIHLFNVEDFKHLKLYVGQNLDNIYKIDYKKGMIITAGQDRRCAIYKPDGRAYYVNGEFLIYAAALSPSSKTGVFASTVENDLQLFNTVTKSKTHLLKGHGATLTDFAFLSETQFFSSAEEKRILFWDITK